MECFRCGNEPCTCQRELEVKPIRQFVIQECSHPGCTVVLRSLAGKQEPKPVCKWHQHGTAYNVTGPTAMRPDSYLPAMTKEEFGLELYEAIRLNGARLACEAKGKTQEAKAFQDQVQVLLLKLKPDDVRRILGMR